MQKHTRSEMRIIQGDAPRCISGKPMYDKKGAVTARNLRMKQGHVKLRVYECPECGRWHLTKSL